MNRKSFIENSVSKYYHSIETPPPTNDVVCHVVDVTDDEGNSYPVVAIAEKKYGSFHVSDFDLTNLINAGIDPRSVSISQSSAQYLDDIEHFDSLAKTILSRLDNLEVSQSPSGETLSIPSPVEATAPSQN
ncbi:hypothetical protein [Capybara microvirus Cap1_SP_48]|nr:hypothetical protein [Capybara microvirus Cap1_SP_48]